MGAGEHAAVACEEANVPAEAHGKVVFLDTEADVTAQKLINQLISE